jgi:hypothetical protein
MHKLWFWCVFTAACAATLPAGAADARPIAEALEVRRGATCVNRDTLGVELSAWLGSEAIAGDVSVLVIGSDSDPRDVSFELRRGGTRLARRRFFPAPAGCGPLQAIVALAIAMALEVSVRDDVMALVDDTRDDSAAWKNVGSNSVAVFAELGLGLLPGSSAGVAVRGEMRSLVAVHLEAFAHRSQSRELRAGPARFDVDAWLAGARLRACVPVPLPLSRELRVQTCAGLGVGGLLVMGRGAAGSRSEWLPWLDVGVGSELRIPLSEHWSIDAGGNLELPFGERRFGVQNSDGSLAASRSLPDLAGSLRAGLAYRF